MNTTAKVTIEFALVGFLSIGPSFAQGVPRAASPQARPVPQQPAPVPKQTAPAQVQPIARPAQGLTPAPAPLSGWVDLHAHPMTNLGFGGKLIHGGVDEQSLLPANHSCQPWLPAGTAFEALGDDRPTHGGWDVSFQCGNNLRHDVVIAGLEGANGALATAGPGRPPTAGLFNLPNLPAFAVWPAWNDITHQKMWWEWIKRARDGGQRVMVALATNNRLLAEALTVGFKDGGPQDDMNSADVQLREMKNFVARHSDFMEVALDSANLERIVRSNRLAVVLGVEIDNIGDFNSLPAGALNPTVIAGEVQRLYNEGVRYVLPIHVVDNVFGATAIYEPFFALADFRETGHYWNVVCARPNDQITWQFNTYSANVTWLVNPLHLSLIPNASPGCSGHRNGGNLSFPPAPGAPGLTNWGVIAVKEMMKRGMIVDIDHMSTDAVDSVLTMAEAVPGGGYPIVSGHSGVRGTAGQNAENSRSATQLGRIARLHGMFGLGTGAATAQATGAPAASLWFTSYQTAMADMGYGSAVYQNGMIAFGTDLNGLVLAPPPPPDHHAIVYGNGSFPLAPSPRKPASDPLPIAPPATWNYNTDGVAHYGMLPEFVYDVRRTMPSQPNGISGVQLVDQHFNRSADHFWHMWQRIEAQRVHVN